jgi:hypothetical protein
MKEKQPVDEVGLNRLAQYWFRANSMRYLFISLLHSYDQDVAAIRKDGHIWELITYMDYWLSGLFVMVEGFNKLKIKDPEVQQLFKEHVSTLKQLRHDTYHFAVERDHKSLQIIRQLNWAEQLHSAIGVHIWQYIKESEMKDQADLLKWRLRRTPKQWHETSLKRPVA